MYRAPEGDETKYEVSVFERDTPANYTKVAALATKNLSAALLLLMTARRCTAAIDVAVILVVTLQIEKSTQNTQ